MYRFLWGKDTLDYIISLHDENEIVAVWKIERKWEKSYSECIAMSKRFASKRR